MNASVTLDVIGYEKRLFIIPFSCYETILNKKT